jgi:hypothetical protein
MLRKLRIAKTPKRRIQRQQSDSLTEHLRAISRTVS